MAAQRHAPAAPSMGGNFIHPETSQSFLWSDQQEAISGRCDLGSGAEERVMTTHNWLFMRHDRSPGGAIGRMSVLCTCLPGGTTQEIRPAWGLQNA